MTLKKAHALSKSVPRQNNRAKWRERSGFAPNMFPETSSKAGRLIEGDVVFGKSSSVEKIEFIVKKDKDDEIEVCQFNKKESKILYVRQDSLSLDKGLIAVVPKNMYNIEEGLIKFDDLVAFFCNNLVECPITLTDEWATILQDDQPNLKKRKADALNSSTSKQLRLDESSRCSDSDTLVSNLLKGWRALLTPCKEEEMKHKWDNITINTANFVKTRPGIVFLIFSCFGG